MRRFGSARKRRGRFWAGSAAVSVVVAAVAAALVTTSASARPRAAAVATQQCGQDVSYIDRIKDPDGVFKKLPAQIKQRYAPWPYSVRATPWETFKGKKPPWKIGLITFPVGSPWLADLIKQVGIEFAKAKAKGLVTGSLLKYIQPSYATATPEQQIAAIQQMVRQGVDGILLLPLAGPPLAPAIDAAGKAGVPVVITDNVIDQAKYVVNVWSQNNSPAAAGVAGLVKKGNILRVRGIPGNPVEQAFEDAATADIKACPGLKVVGEIWGKWTNATAKAETLKWLAAHPTTKVDGVIQNGIMMAGIIQAFQQAGRPVPPISGGGCQGGELSWWLAHRKTYNTVATCFNGYQTAWSEFRILLRILAGKGLKVRDISVPVPIVTSKNVAVYATPGKPLSWPGEPRGPIDGWASNSFLDGYFLKPGNPGGF
ncbi:MAG TPA: substrate-binding domain-containing protein [Gaiellaceae bacterium]|nr:substrate-binding domain-containing protein [Gaiellaceae bacterium]